MEDSPTSGFKKVDPLENDVIYLSPTWANGVWKDTLSVPAKDKHQYKNVVLWIKKHYEELLFTGDYNVTILGIRTEREEAVTGKTKVSNKFQDYMAVTYSVGDKRIWFVMSATTLAGVKYYKKPMNRKGTAQVLSGKHAALWKQGFHKKKRALIQNNMVRVARDYNGDDYHDWDVDIHVGMYGINFHTANKAGTSTQVDGWSAGCQVANIHQEAMDRLLNNLSFCEKVTGYKTYSYILLDDTAGELDSLL